MADNLDSTKSYKDMLLSPLAISQRAPTYLVLHRIILNFEKIVQKLSADGKKDDFGTLEGVYQNISEIMILHLKFLNESDKFSIQDIMGKDEIA